MLKHPDNRKTDILVVEDDRDDFYLLQDVLMSVEGRPYRASWCGSYDAAELLMLEQKFSIAFVDYQIGAKNGLEFISKVGQLYPHCPMILLTGLRSAELDRMAQAAGAADYIPKDLLSTELIDRTIRYTRQHAERWSLLNSIITNVDSGVIGIGEDGEPIIWNEQALRSLDVKKSFGFSFKRDIASRLAEWGYPDALPKEITNENGSVFEVRVSTVVGVGLVLAFHDISERMHVEYQLRETVAAAERANQLQSRFLSTMSHELRTPMNGILGMSQVLERSELSDEQKSMLRTIKRSGEGLLRIINDHLDLSKIEAGAMSIENTEFDLPEVVDEVVRLLAPNGFAKGLELTAYVDPDLWHEQTGDPDRITQVLTNLIGNAIKFTEHGAVDVSVTKVMKNGQPMMHFSVIDTGPGIPDEQQQDLFNWFQQLERTKTSNATGTGLGLALSKQLVTLMNGAIGCVSEVGQGSTFWFQLPATEPNAVAARLAKRNRAVQADSDLLLISANASIRHVVRQYYEKIGGRVRYAVEIEEIFANLRQHDVRHVIVDDSEFSAAKAALVAEMRNILKDQARIWLLQDRTQSLRANDCPFDGLLERPFRKSSVEAFLELIKAQPAKPVGTAEAAGNLEHSMRILMAEDNEANQVLAKLMLGRAGFDLTIAPDGYKAVELAQSGEFDVVLMDICMPGIDGLEATRRIRESEAGSMLPIIAVTADVTTNAIKYSTDVGVDDHLAKPIDWDKLVLMLHQLSSRCAPKPARTKLAAPAFTTEFETSA